MLVLGPISTYEKMCRARYDNPKFDTIRFIFCSSREREALCFWTAVFNLDFGRLVFVIWKLRLRMRALIAELKERAHAPVVSWLSGLDRGFSRLRWAERVSARTTSVNSVNSGFRSEAGLIRNQELDEQNEQNDSQEMFAVCPTEIQQDCDLWTILAWSKLTSRFYLDWSWSTIHRLHCTMDMIEYDAGDFWIGK